MGPPNRACYKHTCRIQSCLSENNYDPRACEWAVEALKKCCRMPHAAYSIHCAFPDIQEERRAAAEAAKAASSSNTQNIEEKPPEKEQNGVNKEESVPHPSGHDGEYISSPSPVSD